MAYVFRFASTGRDASASRLSLGESSASRESIPQGWCVLGLTQTFRTGSGVGTAMAVKPVRKTATRVAVMSFMLKVVRGWLQREGEC